MTGVFAAEWLKLRKRPAAWVIGLIWLALVFLLGYLLPYALLRSVPHRHGGSPGVDRGALVAPLLPRNILHELLPPFANLGGALVLILAVVTMGSEYGWGTLKTILTQRPGRLTVLIGRLLALALALALLVALTFVAGGVGSLLVAVLEHERVEWPPLPDILRGIGALLLIFATWAAIGLGLAVLLRGTSLAIGLGLVYALVIENLIRAFSGLGSIVRTVSTTLPGVNANALANAFASSSGGFRASVESPVGVGQAILALSTYIVVFVVLVAFILLRRDVAS